jgi:glycosyltransferase involved in cell wall biosynthesis
MKILYEEKGRHIVITRMEPYWKSKGCFIFSDPSICDVQLSVVRVSKERKIPVVVRIDGIYYDLDTNYKVRNSSISLANSVADGVIYQSNYSKALCEKFLHPRKKGSICRVIYNGVDQSWCGKRVDHKGINIVVISKWRRHKRLKEIISLFLEFIRIVPDSTLHILGKLHDNKKVNHSKIVYYDMVERNEVGKILNLSDFSLHLSKRDSCPNSVVECIGAGVPVITSDKCGGATEMCLMTKGCVVCKGDFDNDFQPNYPYREEFNILTPELRENILEFMVEISKDKRTVELPIQLTAEYMAQQYIDIMEEVRIDGR